MSPGEKTEKTQGRVVSAKEKDVPEIRKFIHALAVYEKLEHEMVATDEGLRATLFGPKPVAEVVFVEDGGVKVGFALFFHSYSTFLGKPGLYLEDLFVLEEYRGRGHGKLLLANLARMTVERDCGRLEWSVLDWNKPSINFYLSLGSVPRPGWTVHRLTGGALKRLAET